MLDNNSQAVPTINKKLTEIQIDFLLDQDSYHQVLRSLVENKNTMEFQQCLKIFKKGSVDLPTMVKEVNTLISNCSTFDKDYHMFLYYLYENDQKIDESFSVLVRIGDHNIYDQFDKIFRGKKNDHKEKVITENVTKLIDIDLRKTWEKLQQLNETFAKK